ncbi:MAG: SDR family NAD(P)-dependent oxidoreductase [Magnetococcales bacterium]|nr:SDR family NAD(P)-dependent oxidoreductase [Nitrospirota bacterium]
MGVLQDKVIIITGATRGIGKAIARSFYNESSKLALCSRNEAVLIEEVEKLHKLRSDQLIYAVCDTSKYDEVHSFIKKVYDAYGRIDVLVNNAGIGIFGKVESFDIFDWQKVMDVNFNGCFYFCHDVIPILRENKSSPKGYIFNIGSISSKLVVEGNSAYSSSKAALKAFSDHLYNELRGSDIQVSYLTVGSVDTTFSMRNVDETGWKIKPGDIGKIVLQMASLAYSGISCCITDVEIRTKYPVRREFYKE